MLQAQELVTTTYMFLNLVHNNVLMVSRFLMRLRVAGGVDNIRTFVEGPAFKNGDCNLCRLNVDAQ